MDTNTQTYDNKGTTYEKLPTEIHRLTMKRKDLRDIIDTNTQTYDDKGNTCEKLPTETHTITMK